jgi:hypothetical protein
VAVYCCVVPFASVEFAGVTLMDVSVAAVIVTLVEPDTAPMVALIVAEPTVTPATTPMVPAALLADAIAAEDELHVASAVTSRLVLSL